MTLFGIEGRTDTPEVLAAYEVDYTPSAVAVQLVLALDWLTELRLPSGNLLAPRFLCPAAGSGVWPQALRAVFGADPLIVGADIRADGALTVALA